MVVVSTFEVSTIFEKTKLTFDGKDEEKGITKKGDPFVERKLKYLDPQNKKTPLIVRFAEVESFGMKEFKNGTKGRSYSFSIVLDSIEEERIEGLVRRLERFVKRKLPTNLAKSLSF